jgi:hypothetical protein
MPSQPTPEPTHTVSPERTLTPTPLPTSTPTPKPTPTPLPTSTPTPKPIQRDAILPACLGEGVDQAAIYNPDQPGIHPLRAVTTGSSPNRWDKNIPADWLAESVNDLELVICIDDEVEKEIERCEYIGKGNLFVTRHQHKRTVRLVEAKTGTMVATHTFFGPLPRECNDIEFFSTSEQEQGKELDGGIVEITRIDLVLWLRPFVE